MINNAPSLHEIEEDFLRAMGDAGLAPGATERLIFDGAPHLYHVDGDKPRTRRGRYCVFLDGGRPAGWFKTYAHGAGDEVYRWAYRAEHEPAWSAEDRARYAQEAERSREQKMRDKRLSEAQAIKRAREKWDAATAPDPKHPYLVRKKVLAHGIRQLGRDLIIPLLGPDGALMTIQRILPARGGDGGTDKLFQPGAPKLGASFLVFPEGGGEGAPLSPPPRMLWLCEGYATAATVAEASGQPAIMAVDAGNLAPVARIWRERYPGAMMAIAADWDQSHGNPGMAAALAISDDMGFPVVPPSFAPGEQGSDWNDYAAIHGAEQTRNALRDGLRKALEAPQLQEIRRERMYPHTTEKGYPKKTIGNLEALLGWLGVEVRYNEIKKEQEFRVPHLDYGVDNALNAGGAWITSQCAENGLGLGSAQVGEYLLEIAARNPYNPVRDWIRSAPWDGVSRIAGFLRTIETPSDFPAKMKECLISAWMVSAVAAACAEKGFSSRGVLVLQGEQALGKTSWFRALVPPESGWFGEGLILDPADKDSLKQFVSHWICELGELEGTFRRADLARLKSFITRGSDLLRLPWARKMSEYPRRTVLCASVNQQEVLLDSTGNSRWWCVPCRGIDYRHGIDMQQLWSEMAERWSMGEQWWLDGDFEAALATQNRDFESLDPVEDLIASRLDWESPQNFWTERTVTDILIEVGIDRPQKVQVTQAGIFLRKLTGLGFRRSHGGSRLCLAPPKKTQGFYP